MTGRHDDLRMVDDLAQGEELRALLRAGIDDEVDYDYAGGLSAHLAAVAALPTAAESATGSDAVIDAAAQGSNVVSGVSGKVLVAWIGGSVASVAVIAALWFGTRGATESTSSSVPAAPAIEAPPVAPTLPSLVAARAPEAAVQQAAVQPEAVEPAAVEPAASVAIGSDTVDSAPRAANVPRAQRNAAAVTATPKAITTASSASSTSSATTPAASTVASTVTTTDTATAEASTVVAEVAAPAPEAAPSAAELAARAEQEREARDAARREAEARLQREMAQLMTAKKSLESQPSRALALAEAGEREFQGSMFSEERQHVLLLALINLGRIDEAERRAQPFLRAHPDSPFARRVRNALQAAKP